MSHEHIDRILSQFRDLSRDERGKGRLFERLIANYLVRDPQYSDLLEHVWLWEEWQDRWGADVGIGSVAKFGAAARSCGGMFVLDQAAVWLR